MEPSSQKQRFTRSKLSLRHKKSSRVTASVSQPVSLEPAPPQALPCQLLVGAAFSSPPRHPCGLPACSVVLQRCTPSKSPLKEGQDARLEGSGRSASSPHATGDAEAIPSPLHDGGSKAEGHMPASSNVNVAMQLSPQGGGGGGRKDPCRGNEEEAGVVSETFPSVVSGAGPVHPLVCQICRADLSGWSLAERETHVNACCDRAEEEESRGDIQQVAPTHRCVLCEKTLPSRQVWIASAT